MKTDILLILALHEHSFTDINAKRAAPASHTISVKRDQHERFRRIDNSPAFHRKRDVGIPIAGDNVRRL